MQLKQEANSEPRKKFHMINRMHKAVKHSALLELLSKSHDNIDAQTKLEVLLISFFTLVPKGGYFAILPFLYHARAYKRLIQY